MIQYEHLQIYWWFLISVLGAILVFLLFVQGGQSMLFHAKNDIDRTMMVNSLGRKWELTFTTLVVFGGRILRIFPAILFNKFRRSILAVDFYPFQLYYTGGFIRVQAQAGQYLRNAHIRYIPVYKRSRRFDTSRSGCGYILFRRRVYGRETKPAQRQFTCHISLGADTRI